MPSVTPIYPAVSPSGTPIQPSGGPVLSVNGRAGAVTLTRSDVNLSDTQFLAVLTSILNALPTSLPASAGVLWNNGGVIAIS